MSERERSSIAAWGSIRDLIRYKREVVHYAGNPNLPLRADLASLEASDFLDIVENGEIPLPLNSSKRTAITIASAIPTLFPDLPLQVPRQNTTENYFSSNVLTYLKNTEVNSRYLEIIRRRTLNGVGLKPSLPLAYWRTILENPSEFIEIDPNDTPDQIGKKVRQFIDKYSQENENVPKNADQIHMQNFQKILSQPNLRDLFFNHLELEFDTPQRDINYKQITPYLESVFGKNSQFQFLDVASHSKGVNFMTEAFNNCQAQSINPVNAFDTPFKSGTFDVVNCSYVFPYLTDHGCIKMLEETQRILKEDGILIIQPLTNMPENDDKTSLISRKVNGTLTTVGKLPAIWELKTEIIPGPWDYYESKWVMKDLSDKPLIEKVN